MNEESWVGALDLSSFEEYLGQVGGEGVGLRKKYLHLFLPARPLRRTGGPSPGRRRHRDLGRGEAERVRSRSLPALT